MTDLRLTTGGAAAIRSLLLVEDEADEQTSLRRSATDRCRPTSCARCWSRPPTDDEDHALLKSHRISRMTAAG